jgi:SAM-dependent methyltransferase
LRRSGAAKAQACLTRSPGMRATAPAIEAVSGQDFGAEHGPVEDPLLKRALLRLMPGESRHRLLGAVRGALYRGDMVECPCCESSSSRFLPHRGRERAKCPRCGSLERHRVLWLFLERETDLFERPGAMLHIAPEYALHRRLSQVPGLRYVTGDLDSALATHQLDVMELPFAAGSFDFLICNHVLEHVESDRRALAEIHRVLAPGGWAILMCPVDHRRAATLEDPGALTPGERHRLFGQSDHVRLYGRDYADRLAEAGFAVRTERYVEACDSSSVARFGLRREQDDAFGEEEVFLCVKSGASDGRAQRTDSRPRRPARNAAA